MTSSLRSAAALPGRPERDDLIASPEKGWRIVNVEQDASGASYDLTVRRD